MSRTSKVRAAFVRTAVMAVFAVAFVGADGCANDQDADPTPVQTFKITPAANATASLAASAAPSSPTATAPTRTPGEPGSSVIEIAAVSSTFDVEELEARAGTVTIEFDNRDGGVIHNLHVFRGDDADGDSVAETELDVGPVKQTLSFDVQPGEYFYQCDSHPTTMNGELTVE